MVELVADDVVDGSDAGWADEGRVGEFFGRAIDAALAVPGGLDPVAAGEEVLVRGTLGCGGAGRDGETVAAPRANVSGGEGAIVFFDLDLGGQINGGGGGCGVLAAAEGDWVDLRARTGLLVSES